MLLIGDDKISYAFRDGVFCIFHLHLERADGRMPRIRRAEDMAKVGIRKADVRNVVQE